MDFNNKALMKTINKQLGILCSLLVPLCVGFGMLGIGKGNEPDFWFSVSDTFYANSNIFMIGLLFATSVLFFSYRGYDTIDNLIADISGAAAFGVIMFPCYSNAGGDTVGVLEVTKNVSHVLHCLSAATLFISFAVMIGWRFTRTSLITTKKKKLRNIIYYVCAGIISVFMINQVITSILGIAWFTIINEFFMLVAFGFAWLVKGEAFKFLND